MVVATTCTCGIVLSAFTTMTTIRYHTMARMIFLLFVLACLQVHLRAQTCDPKSRTKCGE